MFSLFIYFKNKVFKTTLILTGLILLGGNLFPLSMLNAAVAQTSAAQSLTVQTTAPPNRGISLTKSTRPEPLPLSSGIFRALIVGNNIYADTKGQWPSLSTAVDDARAVENLFRNHYGFTDIVFLEDATRREVLLALADMSKRVLANDSVVVYYAGHGYLDTESNRGYWVPTDAMGTDHTTFLRNSTIRDELSIIAKRAKHTLLISDSCFSGTLLRSSTRGINENPNSEAYYNKVAKKKSVQIMSAGGIEFVDDNYQQSGHSPFTYFLVNELKANDKPLITVSELSSNVNKAVANNVNQVPESGVLQGAGDELGEFIFIKVKVSVEVEGVPKDNVKVTVDVSPENNQQQVVVEPTTVIKEKSVSRKPAIQHNTIIPLPSL